MQTVVSIIVINLLLKLLEILILKSYVLITFLEGNIYKDREITQ